MCKRGSVKLRLASAFVTIILLSLSAHAQDQHGPKKKIIFDQDTDGVIGGNENPLIMLLQADNIDVMGVTVVTGNG
jgi:purine nucleosidase